MPINYDTYELSRQQKTLFLAAAYSVISIVVFLFFRIPILSAVSGCLALLLLPFYSAHLAEKRRELLKNQFRDLLTVLSASIESGSQMEEALIDAEETMRTLHDADSPINEELRHMKVGLTENNDSDVSLLTDLADRSGCSDIRNFVQVYLACRTTGGDIGMIISHTVRIMTDRMEISKQISVLTAQKKLEGRMISAMPLVMLLILNLISPAYIEVLYTTIAGRLIMCISLAGICTGIWLMERLTDVSL